jgi:uncharacterized membrane protein YqhA
LGLILAQAVYVFHFWVELVHLIQAAMGNQTALQAVFTAVGVSGDAANGTHLTETTIMLVVLGLIDVVMISNLLIMVIVGGYETFVSRMNLEGHPPSSSPGTCAPRLGQSPSWTRCPEIRSLCSAACRR